MTIDAYIDGSSRGNPGPGGYGVVFVRNDGKILEYGRFFEHTTNNQMELQAVIAALKEAELFLKADGQNILCVRSDSAYVVNGITTWLQGWKRKGWITSQKQPVLNQDLWKHIDSLMHAHSSRVRIEKVAGHAGVEFNERADVIATSFALGKPIELKREFSFLE